MIDLKIYLIIYKNDIFKVRIHRVLETLMEEWKKIFNDCPLSSCLIHIGFNRPDVDEANKILSILQGKVFLTESAYWGFPSNLVQDCEKINISINKMPVYIALDNWGYKLDKQDDILNIFNTKDSEQNDPFDPPTDWVYELYKDNHDLYKAIRQYGVSDDKSYKSVEIDEANYDLIEKIDNYRFYYYLKRIDSSNIFSLLKIAPRRFLELEISKMNLSVRISKIFHKLNIVQLKDLLNYSELQLLEYRNFGRKSLRVLSGEINEDLAEFLNVKSLFPDERRSRSSNGSHHINRYSSKSHRPPGIKSSIVIGPSSINKTLFECINSSLAEIKNNRNREIVEKRLGKLGKNITLEELGIEYNLTKERVRQIVDKQLTKIKRRIDWNKILENKLNKILSVREKPLLCELVEIEDEWFSGFGNNIVYLENLIEYFTSNKYNIIKFNNKEIVSRIDQTAFEELMNTCRTIFEDFSKQELRRSDVHLIIEITMKHRGAFELSPLIFEKYNDSLIYVNNKDEDRKLIAFGSSAENIVKAILYRSDTPLHYQDITSIANKIYPTREYNERRIHNALGSIEAYLFGRGVYGLYKHLPITKKQMENILRTVEGIIISGDLTKQWHCSELMMLLDEEHPDVMEIIDLYILNIILHQSEYLKSLGRMVWMSKSSKKIMRRRIDMSQAFETILEEYGEPLRTEELKELLSDQRGVHTALQIHPSKKMIRLEPGLWGLIHRDVYLSQEDISSILDKLYLHLNSTKKAIHVSELDVFFKKNGIDFPEHNKSYVIMSLSTLDERFKTAIGGFLSLKNWVDIGRLSIAAALHEIVKTMKYPMTTDQIAQQAKDMTEREIDKDTISRSLISLDLKYDNENLYWFPP